MKLNDVAKKAGMPLSDLAIAWPLHMGISCVIVGATKVEQVKSNAKAVAI